MICSGWTCFCRWVGLDHLQWSFPTLTSLWFHPSYATSNYLRVRSSRLGSKTTYYKANKILHSSHNWQQCVSVLAYCLVSPRPFQVLTDEKHSFGRVHSGKLHTVSLFHMNHIRFLIHPHSLLRPPEYKLKSCTKLLLLILKWTSWNVWILCAKYHLSHARSFGKSPQQLSVLNQ